MMLLYVHVQHDLYTFNYDNNYREIWSDVYGNRQTSHSSQEFFTIEQVQLKTVQNNNITIDKSNLKLLILGQK